MPSKSSENSKRTPSISPSRVQDFKRCPLLYRLRVVDRLPEPPSPAALKGTLVHAVLEALYGIPAIQRTREAAHGLLPEQWQALTEKDPANLAMFDTPEELADWLAAADALVDAYFRLEDPQRLEPRARELMVTCELPGGVALKGFVDRLDVAPTGEIRIVDYKTGKAPRPGYEAQALFQLKCYALAVWRDRGVVPRMVQLLYLADGQVLRHSPTREELEATEKSLLAVWQAIEESARSGRWRATRGPLCPWCSHQSICPEFGGTPPPVPVDALARLGLAE